LIFRAAASCAIGMLLAVRPPLRRIVRSAVKLSTRNRGRAKLRSWPETGIPFMRGAPGSRPMPHIEVANVSLTYDTPAGRVPGVEGVSFDIAASEFLCIVGPSGCGKSTLLNIIAGFLVPTAGGIRHRRQPGSPPRRP